MRPAVNASIFGVVLAAALAWTTPAAAQERYERARDCAVAGDHACVIRELRGHCETAREFELLISSMRAVGGYDRDIEEHMRTYCGRFGCRRPGERDPGYYFRLPHL